MEVEKFWILLKCQPRDACNSTTFLCQGDQMSNLRLLHFASKNTKIQMHFLSAYLVMVNWYVQKSQ